MPGEKPGVLHRVKRIVQFPFEVAIHASDHIVLQRHSGFLRGFWILPREILGDVFDQSFDDGPHLALDLDLRLDLLLNLDGVDFRRPLVQRPKVLVDANVRLDTRIESFGVRGRSVGFVQRVGRTRCRQQHRFWPRLRHRARVGHRGAVVCLVGLSDRAGRVPGFVSRRLGQSDAATSRIDGGCFRCDDGVRR